MWPLVRTVALSASLASLLASPASAGLPVFIDEWGGPRPDQFVGPQALAAGPNGHLYVAEPLYAQVREVSASGALVRLIQRGGPNDPSFLYTEGVAVAPDGTVYVAEGCYLHSYTSAGAWLGTWSVCGDHRSVSAGPYAVAVDRGGAVYVSSLVLAGTQPTAIAKYEARTGRLLGGFGTPGTGDGQIADVTGIAVDSDGFVYASDGALHRVMKYAPDGTLVRQIGRRANSPGAFNYPTGVAIDSEGTLYVADAFNDRVQAFTRDGDFLGIVAGPGTGIGEMRIPSGIATDPFGHLFVSEPNTNRVTRFGLPPVADAGRDTVVECGGVAHARVRLDGRASRAPSRQPLAYHWHADGVVFDDSTSATPTADFPFGATLVTLRVGDGTLEGADEVLVTVADRTAPGLTVELSRASLWPPNHRLVPVHATVVANDACDPAPAVRLVSVTSDEPDPGTGPGDARGDISGAALGTADFDFQLRAERDPAGDGRTYTVCYEAADAAGQVTRTCTGVSVPRDRGVRGGSGVFPVDPQAPADEPAALLRFGATVSPNPARGGTVIRYALPANGPVTLSVFDVSGRHVATLVRERQAAGEHAVPFVAAGRVGRAQVLLYRLTWGEQSLTGRFMVLP